MGTMRSGGAKKPLMTAGMDKPIWAMATAPAAATNVPRLSFRGAGEGPVVAAVSLMVVKQITKET